MDAQSATLDDEQITPDPPPSAPPAQGQGVEEESIVPDKPPDYLTRTEDALQTPQGWLNIGKGALSEVGGMAKAAITGRGSQFSGAIYDAVDQFKELPPIYRAYETAKSQGKSIKESIEAANQEAQRQHEAHDFLTERLKELKDNPASGIGRAAVDVAALAAPLLKGEYIPNVDAEEAIAKGVPRGEAGTAQQQAAANIRQTQGAAVGAAKAVAMPEGFTLKLGPATELGKSLGEMADSLGKTEGLESLKDPEVVRAKAVIDELRSDGSLDAAKVRGIKDQLNTTIDQLQKAVRNGTANGTALGLYKQVAKAFNEEIYRQIHPPQAAEALKTTSAKYAETVERQTKGPASPLFKAKTPEQIIKRLNSTQTDGTTVKEFLIDKTPEQVQKLRNDALRDLSEQVTKRGKTNWNDLLDRFEGQRDAAKALYGEDYDKLHADLQHMARMESMKEGAKNFAIRAGKYGLLYIGYRTLLKEMSGDHQGTR